LKIFTKSQNLNEAKQLDKHKISYKVVIFVFVCAFAIQTASAYSYSVTTINNYRSSLHSENYVYFS